MKTYSVLAALLASILLYTSCCTKRGCGDYAQSFTLEGFAETELDSLVVTEHDAQSVVLDTLNYYPEYPKGDFQVLISVDKYYIFHCGNRTYRLDNFNIIRKTCNKCIWGDDYYTFLASYNINGIAKYRHYMNSRILINKND